MIRFNRLRGILGIFFFSIFLPVNAVIFAEDAGKIPVMEYHVIGKEEQRWTRSIDNFKNDLLFLYNNDYRTISVKDFLSGNIVIEKGKKPVVLTFDDASLSQFSFKEDNSLDENCAVKILEDFCLKYSDFGCKAVFFVNNLPFKQKDSVKEKLNYLIAHNFDIGNHTFSHVNLPQNKDIEQELGKLNNYLLDLIDREYVIDSLAYPFGAFPKNLEKIKEGSYEGKEYKIAGAFLVGAEPSNVPSSKNFDPYKIPRIQATDEEWKRHFNRINQQTTKGKENFLPFTSKGKIEKENMIPPKFRGNMNYCPFVQQKSSALKNSNFVPRNQGEKIDFLAYFLAKSKEFIPKFISFKKVPKNLIFEDGEIYYQVSEGDNFDLIADKFQRFSLYHVRSDFIKEIKKLNEIISLEVGQKIVLPPLYFAKFNLSPLISQRRGVYLTSSSVFSSGKKFVDALIENGGNMFVFDVKAGKIAYETDTVSARNYNDLTGKRFNLEAWVNYLHSRGVLAVARVVTFKDDFLVGIKPEWTLKSASKNKKLVGEAMMWLDPSNKEVVSYLNEIARDLAEKGVDEIQFDYIRFPASGGVNFVFAGQKDGISKEKAISNFLQGVKKTVGPYGTKISIDVFGVTAWSDYDAKVVGQNIRDIVKIVDVVYPMIYPSHFGKGYDGKDDPANEPYHFVKQSLLRFAKLNKSDTAKIVPWFQGFPLKVKNFGLPYMQEQKKAVNDLGEDSFVIWSPGNKYTYSYAILAPFFASEK